MIDFEAALKQSENPPPAAEPANGYHETRPAGSDVSPLDDAKHQLMQFRAAVQGMQSEATALTVEDELSEKRCAEMTAQVKSLKKQIEAKQDTIISEPQRFVKAVQAFTLPFRKDLEAIEAQLKRKLGDYAYRKEMDRRKAEAAAQRAADEAQEKINQEARMAGIDPVRLPQPIVPQETGPVRTESGTSSTRFEWAYEVTEPGKVPAQYLAADPTDRTKVMNAIRAGVRDIPGLRIFEKPIVRTRTA